MGTDTIECCSNNIDFGTWKRLLGTEFNVNKQYCLQRCGLCHNENFIIHDGELITADDHETMMRALLGEHDE